MKNIAVKGFVAYLRDVLGANGAAKILDAYGITPNMEANLFWSRLLVLTGDLTFSGKPSQPSCQIRYVES